MSALAWCWEMDDKTESFRGRNMSVKMIAVDLDDTLLHPDKSLSNYTLDVLHCCRERGIIIVIATGRTEKACTRFLPLIKPDAEIYSCGALAQVGNKYCAKPC